MWVLLGVVGCGWRNDDQALRTELEDARREIATLRTELDALAESAAGGVDGVVASPPPTRVKEAPPARARELATHEPARRRDVEAAEDLAGAVDDALGVLEADVDEQARALRAVEASMRDLSAIIDNHAGLIDVLGGEIEVLNSQLALLRALEGTLEVEAGQVRIVDADLVLVPGRDEDGRIKSNGQLRSADPTAE
ncbi:MAG: hypothetical protein AAF211_29615 [Myxococcota bacterium]